MSESLRAATVQTRGLRTRCKALARRKNFSRLCTVTSMPSEYAGVATTKIFGADHLSVAITAACMGDVYEKLGEYSTAIEYFEECMRVKTLCQGRHSLDVARILHKLSKLNFLRNDYHTANSYISRTILVYRLNKVKEDHAWMVDANRDCADIDAAIAVGTGRQFEC